MMDLSYKRFFKTLANENRLKIIKFLGRNGPSKVAEIVEGTKLEQSSISHNLRRLLSCHFVEVEANGRERIYKLNEKTIKPLIELMDTHVSRYCAHCEDCAAEAHSSSKII